MQEKKIEKIENKTRPTEKPDDDVLVRIFGYDIKGGKNIYSGLTYIKGVSWSISHALCFKLGLDKSMKISQLDKNTIKKIESALSNMDVPIFLKNRRADMDSGTDKHLVSTNLDIRKEFDIKRMKKIKSYKGIRHSMGLPVRGQRTRSHFRQKGKAVGVKKKNDKKA